MFQILEKEIRYRCIFSPLCISRFYLSRRRQTFVVVLVTLIGLSISSCNTTSARLTYEFESDPLDERIQYETGTENEVAEISAHLDRYIEQIESAQFAKFKDAAALKIYFFNEKLRYSRFMNINPLTFGGATINEASISVERIRERLSEELCQSEVCPETVKGILLHELSHVHMRQYVGSWRYGSDIPNWFHEGLATLVSDGSGAGLVSEEDARMSILSGSHFVPVDTGSLIRKPKTVGDLRPGTFRFYRQSQMFLEFLLNTNPTGFQSALKGIRAGQKFRTVWEPNYGDDIAGLWKSFMLAL